MKKVVVAADSFKGSLDSKSIASAFCRAAEKSKGVFVVGFGVSDGGEGSVAALAEGCGFKKRSAEVAGPNGDSVRAEYAVKNFAAAIETAAASGLTLIPYSEHNALITTTYGTGELVMRAIKEGAREILLFAGGSATNDGGAGALSAMGFRFLDGNGAEFLPTGGTLQNISSVKLPSDNSFSEVSFRVLSDVTNPLLGRFGATYVYGPQKGATKEDLEIMERGMENFCAVTKKATGVSLENLSGAGAAGGLSGGMAAYLGATIESGADYVLKLTGVLDEIKTADAVITGEGKIDSQTLSGKIVSKIAAAAKSFGVPLYGIAGTSELSEKELEDMGFSAVETLEKYASSREDSIVNAKKYLAMAAENLIDRFGETKRR